MSRVPAFFRCICVAIVSLASLCGPLAYSQDIKAAKNITQSGSWIEDAITMVKFIEDNQLIMRDDSYDKYEELIQKAPSQEKMDRLHQLLVDSMFVRSQDITDRFKPYYLEEIEKTTSREHRDSLHVLEVATTGLEVWSYRETIDALEEIASDPDTHPYAAIRALSIAGFLYGYSENPDRVISTIHSIERLLRDHELNPFIAKEVNGLKGFSAHLMNDPEEMVKLSIEALNLSYNTNDLIFGDILSSNFTHLVMQFGDAKAAERIDAINRRIAHMTGKDTSIFRAYVLCIESAVQHVRTPHALMCSEQAEKFKVENTQSDVRFNLYGMIAFARDGQIDKSNLLLSRLNAIQKIQPSNEYDLNIDWALAELNQAKGQYANAFSDLRSHFHTRLVGQKLELGEVSRAMRRHSEEKSALLQERADNLAKQDALHIRVIYRQKLLIFVSILLVAALLYLAHYQRQNSQKLKSARDEMANANETIRIEARTDQLTRIGNRRAFYEYYEQIAAKYPHKTVTFSIIDLDGFKGINDTYGHETGDELIKETAARLQKAFKSQGQVFRLGGDEMAIFFLGEDDNNASAFKKCVAEGLQGAVYTASGGFDIYWSVGLMRMDISEFSPSEFLKSADYALYEAKKIKGNSFHIFTSEDLEMMQRDHVLPEEVFWNLENDEFRMFGQIVVDIRGGEFMPFGVETLLRAQTRSGDPIPPELFVKHAVSFGKTEELTRLTFTKSIDLIESSGLNCPLLFNLSREQLHSFQFPNNILEIIKAKDFPADRVILELSEHTLKNDLKSVKSKLKDLQQKGIRIALDDFGTANTGFSTLFDFGFDIIKTDRELLSMAMETPRTQMLLENIIKFGHSMGMICVVEGTETREEVAFVKRLGGDVMQGYLFGIPEETPKFRPHIKWNETRENGLVARRREA